MLHIKTMYYAYIETIIVYGHYTWDVTRNDDVIVS